MQFLAISSCWLCLDQRQGQLSNCLVPAYLKRSATRWSYTFGQGAVLKEDCVTPHQPPTDGQMSVAEASLPSGLWTEHTSGSEAGASRLTSLGGDSVGEGGGHRKDSNERGDQRFGGLGCGKIVGE